MPLGPHPSKYAACFSSEQEIMMAASKASSWPLVCGRPVRNVLQDFMVKSAEDHASAYFPLDTSSPKLSSLHPQLPRRHQWCEAGWDTTITISPHAPLNPNTQHPTNLMPSTTKPINSLSENNKFGITGPQAGVNMPEETSVKELVKMVLGIPMAEFNNVFAVNVTGVLYNSMAFLALLEEGNKPDKCLAGVKSQVLVTGSIAAFNTKTCISYEAVVAGVII
ncbi:3-oxoacyl-[acyl-carrier protein] reductase [Venturia nashicola]|uniref:3-oxoacyl-[acyl-carrier protein] reductase n=1 Tax=Venturia nashicola TaxID=86259 RepID=A0A4Z1NYB0_9PEZI|nr:3-oxoacyl-[acyl-carrier protein] reductase [Venturia nashicola]